MPYLFHPMSIDYLPLPPTLYWVKAIALNLLLQQAYSPPTTHFSPPLPNHSLLYGDRCYIHGGGQSATQAPSGPHLEST